MSRRVRRMLQDYHKSIANKEKEEKSSMSHLPAPNFPPLNPAGCFLSTPISPTIINPILQKPLLLSDQKYVKNRERRTRKINKDKPFPTFSLESQNKLQEFLNSTEYDYTFNKPPTTFNTPLTFQYYDPNDKKSNYILTYY